MNQVITLGVGGWYGQGVERLKLSLHGKFDGEMTSFKTHYPEGCPNHREVPYGFKPFMFDQARKEGHKYVLWLDASMYAIANINPIFHHIKNHGWYMENCGQFIGVWTKDKVLEDFKVSRDEMINEPLFIAGCFGLNFENEKANQFLDRWLAKSQDGYSFQGAWTNERQQVSQDSRCHGHRHDMSVGSLITRELGMDYLPLNTYMSYYDWYVRYQNDPNYDTSKIKILAQGL